MNEDFIKKGFAQLIEANEAALGLVVAAIAKQMDATKLLEDMELQLQAAQSSKLISPLAIRQATVALAAVEAETLLRRNSRADH